MSFYQDLSSGKENIQLTFPPSFNLEEEYPAGIACQDEANGIHWQISSGMKMLDLREEYQAELLENVERVARWDFEKYYHEANKDNDSPPEKRTADPKWSPVIEAKVIKIGEAKALKVIKRLAYQPSDEFISGHILIPTTDATYELTCHVRSNFTGTRESMLMAKHLSGQGDKNVEDDATFLTQAFMDDPIHDLSFPEHPLSVVRVAQNTMIDEGIKVLKAYVETRESVALPHAGSIVTPPLGFVHAPAFTQMMSSSLAMFSKMNISPSMGQGGLGSITVWKIPDYRLPKSNTYQVLEKYAVETQQAWEKEGALNVEVQSKQKVLKNDVTCVETYTKFEVGEASHSLAYWFIDEAYAVYRIDISGSPDLTSREEFEQLITEMTISWKPMNVSGKEKPWWKFW